MPEAEELGQKIDIFLGEFRIMVPAVGALLGFQLTVAFQQSFFDLPVAVKAANFGGALCTALCLVFLLVPSGYHRFSRRLDESGHFLHFAQRMVSTAFVFLTLGLTLSMFVQAARTFQAPVTALVVAALLLCACAVFWWMVPVARGRRLEKGEKG